MVAALQKFVMGIVSIALTLGIGIYVLSEFATADGLNGTTAGTNVQTLGTKLAGATTWVGILILVVFASAVLIYFYQKGD